MTTQIEDLIRAQIKAESQAKIEALIKDRVKAQILNDAQALKQTRGENWLNTNYHALSRIDEVRYEDYNKLRTRSNPDETYGNIRSMPIDVLRSIIIDELPEIFKIGTSEKDCKKFLGHLTQSVYTSSELNMFTETKNNKGRLSTLLQEYNKRLNYILQHVSTDQTDDKDLLEKRSILCQMQLFKSFGKFDGVDRTRSASQIASQTDSLEVETRFVNFDDNKVTSSQPVTMRVGKTVDRLTGESSQGCVFAFELSEDCFDMLCHAVETARPDQLVVTRDRNIVTNMYGACLNLSHNAIVFYIDLHLLHGVKKIATIPSTSQKIIHHLCNFPLNQKGVRKILTESPSVGGWKALGLYTKYHFLVIKKIYQLISASHAISTFPYVTMECFRPGCAHHNIFDRAIPGGRTQARCTKCHIADFCLLCGKVSHGGACDITHDEASDEWIVQNTKPCPACGIRVNKDGGCNHMKCPLCEDVHFCWTCNMQYTLNEIHDHYAGDPYGRCVGIVVPQAAVDPQIID